MGLMADLGGGPLGVDTAIFIYFIEEHPQFLPLVEPLFREVNEGRKELVTSALTLLEVLVVPYRSGDHLLAGRYEALLTQSRGVHVADISRDHLRAAAQLFLLMIATFQPYPVSVSCNYLPTFRPPDMVPRKPVRFLGLLGSLGPRNGSRVEFPETACGFDSEPGKEPRELVIDEAN